MLCYDSITYSFPLKNLDMSVNYVATAIILSDLQGIWYQDLGLSKKV